MLSLLYLVVKAQQSVVTSSCMFLDDKTVCEIWLNPGFNVNHLSRNRAQMFKFSVYFAIEVEKNRPLHGCFNRGLRSTKDLKRATGHLTPPTNNVRDFKSLLPS